MWTLSYSVKHTIIFFVPPRPGLLNYEIHDNADAHMPLTRLSVLNLVSRLFFSMQRKICLVNDLLCFSLQTGNATSHSRLSSECKM